MLLERTSPQQSCEECFDSNLKCSRWVKLPFPPVWDIGSFDIV